MNATPRRSRAARLAAAPLLFAALLSGCVPIAPTMTTVAPPAGSAPGTVPQPTQAALSTEEAKATLLAEASAIATVATRSLRVRALPTVNSDLIGGVLNGEVYAVTARSSDGMWMELEIPQLGRGWVATDLVLLEGDIVDLPIVAVPNIGPPTPTPTQTPTPLPPGAALLPTPTPAGLLGAGTALTGTAAADGTPEFIGVPITGTVGANTEVRVRVRSGPSTETEIVGHIYPGETFQAVEQTTNGSWTRILGSPTSTENPNGGWVSTPLLTFAP